MAGHWKFSLSIVTFFVIVGWIGFKIVRYFTYANQPVIILKGIDPSGAYARTVACSLSSDNDYKIYEINAKIDNQEVFKDRVKARSFDVPFTIDTTKFSDGSHELAIEAIDSSYHANKTQKTYALTIDNTPLRAAFIDNEYPVFQGKTLHMKIQSNKNSRKLKSNYFHQPIAFIQNQKIQQPMNVLSQSIVKNALMSM